MAEMCPFCDKAVPAGAMVCISCGKRISLREAEKPVIRLSSPLSSATLVGMIGITLSAELLRALEPDTAPLFLPIAISMNLFGLYLILRFERGYAADSIKRLHKRDARLSSCPNCGRQLEADMSCTRCGPCMDILSRVSHRWDLNLSDILSADERKKRPDMDYLTLYRPDLTPRIYSKLTILLILALIFLNSLLYYMESTVLKLLIILPDIGLAATIFYVELLSRKRREDRDR